MTPAEPGAIRHAFVVAGGEGTRLRPLTLGTPKPLLPFCAEPFLEGLVRRLAAAGVGRVSLVVGAETQPFEGLRPAAARAGVDLDVVAEPRPLDTAGGVRSVAEDLDGAVLVLNGDILTDLDYLAVARAHRARDADATMVVVEVDDTSSYGVAVREGTRIVDFVEKPAPGALPGQRAVNAGTYVLEPHVLTALPRGRLSFERDVFPALLRRGGHLEGFVWEGVWADLGTPARYRAGHRLALGGKLDWPALADVPERAPGLRVAGDADVGAGAELVPPVFVAAGARVEAGARVGPFAVVGRGARVGARAVVADAAVLHDRADVGAGVVALGLLAAAGSRVAAGAVVGRDVVVGPGEVIAPGERLSDSERRPTNPDGG